MKTIIISRFILALRRSDQKNRTVESRFSQFAASGIRVPSNGGFVGEMGQLLDHGLLEAEEHDGERDGDATDIGPVRTHGIEHPPLDIADPGSMAGPSGEVRAVICLHAPTVLAVEGPIFSMLQSERDLCAEQPRRPGAVSRLMSGINGLQNQAGSERGVLRHLSRALRTLSVWCKYLMAVIQCVLVRLGDLRGPCDGISTKVGQPVPTLAQHIARVSHALIGKRPTYATRSTESDPLMQKYLVMLIG